MGLDDGEILTSTLEAGFSRQAASQPPDTMRGWEALGEKDTQETHSVWPSAPSAWMVYLHSPRVFQSLMVLSRDCWILSALAIVAQHKHLLARLFASVKYAHLGLYVVRVYKNGVWTTTKSVSRFSFSWLDCKERAT